MLIFHLKSLAAIHESRCWVAGLIEGRSATATAPRRWQQRSIDSADTVLSPQRKLAATAGQHLSGQSDPKAIAINPINVKNITSLRPCQVTRFPPPCPSRRPSGTQWLSPHDYQYGSAAEAAVSRPESATDQNFKYKKTKNRKGTSQ